MFFDTNFIFAGDNSIQVHGLQLVRMGGGMIEQTFSGKAKIEEETSNKWNKPTFYGVSRDPLTFSVTLAKEETSEWTFEERMDIAKWLVQDEYKDFRPGDFPIVLKVIAVGQPTFYNNGVDEGYLEIQFRCDSSNVYTPEVSDTLNLAGNPIGGYTHSFSSSSNIRKLYYPELEITLHPGETSFSIENLSNGSKIEVTGLSEEETIYIDGNNKVVLSSTGLNRVPNLTDLEFLNLTYGNNDLLIKGDIVYNMRAQFPIIL